MVKSSPFLPESRQAHSFYQQTLGIISIFAYPDNKHKKSESENVSSITQEHLRARYLSVSPEEKSQRDYIKAADESVERERERDCSRI
jgi:hypothetical protein